jgi:hypothetical protein
VGITLHWLPAIPLHKTINKTIFIIDTYCKL